MKACFFFLKMQALICSFKSWETWLLWVHCSSLEIVNWMSDEVLKIQRKSESFLCNSYERIKWQMRHLFVKPWANMHMLDTFHTWLHFHKSVHRLAFVSLDLNVRCFTIGYIHHVFIFLKMSCDMERMCSEYMSCHWTPSMLPWFNAINSERLQHSQCNFTRIANFR